MILSLCLVLVSWEVGFHGGDIYWEGILFFENPGRWARGGSPLACGLVAVKFEVCGLVSSLPKMAPDAGTQVERDARASTHMAARQNADDTRPDAQQQVPLARL